ncbi:hypothetical protein A2973_00345 [Candidatus Gottesmanbacteria bacterium RIFCSPLOWO2_01_FULL_49_10]|uniref:AB hydrolase-1 domain-containing protein n=1 Tax=Candidatus Gottesmanbacteria bacterium RIFCSPLOWO2_01_FULL_49_10 TaxID=1798396 RepID=A0A1F6AZS4_9BACT|nr:MAG: hypothetical protein A2973_00345 [Candidatus Gottesmanbacteria bacterium RIFCSPLOWO2_01_FULL_49_10]
MQYPIVNVTTSDGLLLHGLLTEPENRSDAIVIHTHGTSGNFYWNSFYPSLTESAGSMGLSYLATNNRGSGIYELEEGFVPHGAALEHFEDCLLDTDAWIELALSKGYKKIILEGHSFGTEKVVYYAAKGKYKDIVAAVILLGFSDSYGTQKRYLQKTGKELMSEAQQLLKYDKPYQLLSDLRAQADGAIPASATTYVNFFTPGSELSKAFPLRNGKELPLVREIHVPILGVIGDLDEEYTIITIRDAMTLLTSENKLAEVRQIKNSGHGFDGKEEDLAAVIADFLKRRVLH